MAQIIRACVPTEEAKRGGGGGGGDSIQNQFLDRGAKLDRNLKVFQKPFSSPLQNILFWGNKERENELYANFLLLPVNASSSVYGHQVAKSCFNRKYRDKCLDFVVQN